MSIIRDGFQSADLDAPVTAPTLNLDFANSQELDPRITFSRGSVGTFVNKNGLIETAPANQPRFDYDPISGECRGLLIEESRQNLFTNSNDFSASGGNASVLWNGSISANVITSPDGTTNASKFISNTSPTTSHYPQKAVSSVAGNNYTLSVFVKAAEVTTIVLVCGSGSWYRAATFNLITGVATSNSQDVGVTAATTYTITPYPNGWYRCSVTSGSSDGANCFTQIRASTGTKTNGIFGDGVSGFYVYGEQIETGSFPTSYIPTSGSTVTRSADNADMTGSNFTSWANSSVGTFVIRGRGGLESTQNGYGRFVGLGQGGSIGREGLNTRVGIWDTTSIVSVTNSSADVVNRNSNIAASFDGTLRRVVLNGVAFSGISRRNINTIFTQIALGKNGNSSTNYLNGTLSRVAYYPRQLNDAQLQYLTQ